MARPGNADHVPVHEVLIPLFEGVQPLDVAGPHEVLAGAARLVEHRGSGPGYRISLVAERPGPVGGHSGLQLVARGPLPESGPIGTLLVPGGTALLEMSGADPFAAWLRRAADRAERVVSVCTGSFALAAAGLLDGLCATTHWHYASDLARAHPTVDVRPDAIYLRQGRIWTAAGVTAGIDLALALVEEDLGHDLALDVARQLVLFVRRPGGQAQFSTQLAAQAAEREPLRELQAWMPDHLSEDLSVPALAERAFMSPRNFARAFRREVGVTPGAYVERLRVERARLALETGDAPVEAIALQCGFGTVETMRRAFHRRLYVGPAEYRARFRPSTTVSA
jgi:transcriptional regulator GlxA family with amidase domain